MTAFAALINLFNSLIAPFVTFTIHAATLCAALCTQAQTVFAISRNTLTKSCATASHPFCMKVNTHKNACAIVDVTPTTTPASIPNTPASACIQRAIYQKTLMNVCCILLQAVSELPVIASKNTTNTSASNNNDCCIVLNTAQKVSHTHKMTLQTVSTNQDDKALIMFSIAPNTPLNIGFIFSQKSAIFF